MKEPHGARYGPIVEIEVGELFGHYSYRLRMPSTKNENIDRLILLYGDNGAGKTTLLRLVWNLLSPHSNRGHRSFLAATPFRNLKLKFKYGTTINVEKIKSLVGSFELRVSDPKGGLLVDLLYQTGSDNKVRSETTTNLLEIRKSTLNSKRLTSARSIPIESRGDQSYIEFLSQADIAPLFLGDDRQLRSDLEDRAEAEVVFDAERGRYVKTTPKPSTAISLESSLLGASEVLRRLALGGQRTGTESAQNVYIEVLRQLANDQHPIETEAYSELLEQIKTLSSRNEYYAEFDLVPKFDPTEFIKTLGQVPTKRRDLALNIAEPFIESLGSRLDALTDAERLTREFLEQANKFLRDKEVYFRLGEGIRVLSNFSKNYLRSSALSSGERHLLQLLCTTLIAREQSSLFIIDEPELSLNVKWQQSVLQSLLRLTEGTGVQFIVATHSIEMISRNRQSLVRLESDPEESSG